MRWAIALLLACALPALAENPGPEWPLIAEDPAGQYELWLTRESPVIPAFTPASPQDAYTGAERLAFLAGNGNRVAAHIRETQDSRRWFLGMFEPADGATVLEWPHGQTLALMLDDGRQLVALEVIVTRGDWLRMGPVISITPARAIAFEDFEVRYPRADWNYVMVAFPPGKWDAAKAVTLEIRKEAG